jgi:hypothetical protein
MALFERGDLSARLEQQNVANRLQAALQQTKQYVVPLTRQFVEGSATRLFEDAGNDGLAQLRSDLRIPKDLPPRRLLRAKE